jgi:arylsulfatase A-like enzyme/Tfp pilus assembly protein PilF
MFDRPQCLWLLIVETAIFACACSQAIAATQPNIVLVTLESTRADRMGFLGSNRGLTPNLDELARQSIVFERACAQAPLTVVSHATILTGTYPQTHQVNEFASSLETSLPYLPDLLHARGYRTAAFVGSIRLDPKSGWSPGFDRGFDVYDAGFDPAQPNAEGTGDQVVIRAIKWITSNVHNRTFLWVHLNDPQSASGSMYDRAITSADAAVGKLIAALRAHKLIDNSIIAIVADHGESLGAHGEDTHGVFLYDETIRVPLLLKLLQNQMPGKRVRGRVRLLDIAPTVLEAAGVPVPSQMQGQSLLRVAKTSPDTDQPAYSRSDFPQQAFGWNALESWRAGKYLYIRAPKPELYDLSIDPGATRNLASTSRATLATMASRLEAFDSRFEKQGGKPDNRGLSSSEVQKLASLGYVGLEKPVSSAHSGPSGTDPKDNIAEANQVLQAMTSIAQGKVDKAIPALQQTALANTYLAQYGLGVALARRQRYSQAIERLHKAIELQPNSAWAHYEIGASLAKTGDFKTAAVHLELASARLPKFPGAHLLLAETYEHMGKNVQAQAERKKAEQ